MHIWHQSWSFIVLLYKIIKKITNYEQTTHNHQLFATLTQISKTTTWIINAKVSNFNSPKIQLKNLGQTTHNHQQLVKQISTNHYIKSKDCTVSLKKIEEISYFSKIWTNNTNSPITNSQTKTMHQKSGKEFDAQKKSNTKNQKLELGSQINTPSYSKRKK